MADLLTQLRWHGLHYLLLHNLSGDRLVVGEADIPLYGETDGAALKTRT